MTQIHTLRATLLMLISAAYVTTFAGATFVDMGIDYGPLLPTLVLLLVSFLLLSAYARWRGMARLQPVAETLFGSVAIAVPILIATYLAMKPNMPLADDALMEMDKCLPITWRAFIAFIDEHPLLASALSLGYRSFAAQLLVLPMLFCLLRHEIRAYQFVIAYALIGFTAAVISMWYPALGTYSVYPIDPASLKNIDAHFGYFFLAEFHAVRSDPNFVFSLERAAGIVTFPSVHAAVAFLCIWATWANKWLRYPFLVLNILMAVSAVSNANHYFVDVLAALPLTIACVSITISLPTLVAIVARLVTARPAAVRVD
jgi:hypothetical protein